MSAKVVVVYHSGYGHTKAQAEAVHKGASEVAGVTATIITSDDAQKNWDPLNQADAIIFGCPTYMGGPSAQFKAFIDAASKIWARKAGRTNSRRALPTAAARAVTSSTRSTPSTSTPCSIR